VLIVKLVQEAIDAFAGDSFASVAVEVIDGLKLAGGIDQTSNNNVPKKLFRNYAKTNFVEEPTKDQLRSNGADGYIAKRSDKVKDNSIVVFVPRKERVLFALADDESLADLDKPVDLRRITSCPDGFDNVIAIGFVDDLNADTA
jgi:hypothetical protein